MRHFLTITTLCLALGCSAGVREESRAPHAKRMTVPDPVGITESRGSPNQAQRVPLTGQVRPRAVDIYLDTGAQALAAYTIELRYDPQIVAVLDVTAPGAGGFPGAPMVEPASFGRGVTRVVGLHTGGTLPKGRVRVARVVFRPVAASGSSSLSASVLGLYGPGGNPINGQAVLSHHKIIVLAGE